MRITLTASDPLSIVELADPNNDVGGLFTYTVDPNDTGDPSGATLKAIQIGGQLANETWYRIAPAAGFDVHLFEVDVCTLTGDADGSGAVTTSDYSVVKMHLGERNDSRYDLNGSGRITTADYGVVKTRLGTGTPTKP